MYLFLEIHTYLFHSIMFPWNFKNMLNGYNNLQIQIFFFNWAKNFTNQYKFKIIEYNNLLSTLHLFESLVVLSFLKILPSWLNDLYFYQSKIKYTKISTNIYWNSFFFLYWDFLKDAIWNHRLKITFINTYTNVRIQNNLI